MTERPEGARSLACVIPSRNRSALLQDCVESLLVQETSAEYEIIVVDDGSTDDTRDRIERLAEQHPRLSYLRRAPSGLNASRNAGWQATDADVLAFLDDDALAPQSYVDAVLDGVARHPDVDCFGGRIRLRLEGGMARWCGREPLGETELEAGPSDRPIANAWGANLIVTRRGLETVGPFKEDLALYGDEVEWQHRIKRAGGEIIYLPEAWVWHRRLAPDLRLRPRLRRAYRIGHSYPRVSMIIEQHVSPWGGVIQVATGLAHAVRRGCAVGLLRAAQGVGHTLGAVRLLVRGPRSPYLHWTPARRVE